MCWHRHACQTFATWEGVRADRGNRFRDKDARQSWTAIECIIANNFDRAGDVDARQTNAILERSIANGSNGLWNAYARQTTAISECFLAYGDDGVSDITISDAGRYIDITRVGATGYRDLVSTLDAVIDAINYEIIGRSDLSGT